MKTLGLQLHGPEGDVAFPLPALLEELEEVVAALAYAGCPSVRGWSVECVRRMGVSYGLIMEALMTMIDRWGSKEPEKHIHLLSSVTYALTEWLKISLRYDDTDDTVQSVTV
jgi:hypothetical protein